MGINDKIIDKLLQPFSFNFSQLQDIGTLLNHLKKNAISSEDFIFHIEEEKARRTKREKFLRERVRKAKEEWEKIALRCLNCGEPMNLYPVNTNAGNQVDPSLKSLWQCSSCGHEEYSEETFEEQMSRIKFRFIK